MSQKRSGDFLALNRRALLIGAAASAVPMTRSLAQGTFPNKPVTIVIPFAPGGQTDPVGRFIAASLQSSLNQSFIIDNKSGAGGTIGARHVVRSEPDGYTLLLSATGTYTSAPYIHGKGSYDPNTDFTPIVVAAQGAMALVTHPGSGLKEVAGISQTAKTREITFASPGVGSLPHLMGEILSRRIGVNLIHVPYRGGAPAMSDLIAGRVDLFFDVVSNVSQHVQEGKAVALAVTGSQRLPQFGAAPTILELDMSELNFSPWTGLAGPAGVPASIVSVLNKAVNEAISSEDGRALLARIGMTAVGGSPEVMRDLILKQSTIFKRVIEEAGITAH